MNYNLTNIRANIQNYASQFSVNIHASPIKLDKSGLFFSSSNVGKAAQLTRLDPGNTNSSLVFKTDLHNDNDVFGAGVNYIAEVHFEYISLLEFQ